MARPRQTGNYIFLVIEITMGGSMQSIRFLILVVFSLTLFSQSRQTDSLALVAFYNALNGESWNNSWNLNEPMNTWSGVGFSGDRVNTLLFYSNNNMSGTLASEIGNLTELYNLTIRGNGNITGAIPSSIGNLKKLQTFDLRNSKVNEIPNEISRCDALQNIYFYNNQFTSLPDSIVQLSSLVNLVLAEDELSALPDSISKLTNLVMLDLNNNEFTEIPADVYNLPSLNSLNFNRNNLSGSLPEELATMNTLIYIDLGFNNFSGEIPVSYANKANLRQLYLQENELAGAIPVEFGNSSALWYLYVYNNNIDSLPNFTGTNVDAVLQRLYVYGNYIPTSQLIANLGVTSSTYSYSDQRGEGEVISAQIGEDIVLRAPVTHENDTVIWRFNNSVIDSATADTLLIEDIQSHQLGNYTYWIENSSLVAGFDLIGENLRVLVPDSIPPAIVSNFRAEERNSAIQLYWNASSQNDFSMYYLYGEPTGAKASTFIDSTANTDYLVTGLTNDVEYQFSLTAKDVWGNESTHTLDQKIRPDGTPPGLATGLVATAGEQSVHLMWDEIPAPEALGHHIFYGTDSASLVSYSTTANEEIYINNLVNNQEYYFSIAAYDRAGNYGDTTTVVAATPMDAAPPAPIEVATTPNFEEIRVTWNIERIIPDFYAYKIYMGTSPNPTTAVDSLLSQYGTNSSSLNFVFDSLMNGSTYYFRLKTFDTNGNESEFSNEVSASPDNYRQQDSLALVQIYNDMDGENWSSAWNLDNEITTWAGVTVNNNRVTELNLYNRNLSGELSSAFGSLPELGYLYVGNDDITGSIPPEIGNLSKLYYFYVRNTQITSIPAEFGNLTNLTTLNLFYNYSLKHFNASLENLDKLNNLNIHSNDLLALPEGISGMANLTTLNGYNNELNALPDDLATSTTIHTINVSGNHLTSVPTNFGSFSSLTSLNLSNNNFGSFPNEITSLSNLRTLNFGGSNLSSIPAEIIGLTNLTSLSLTSNNINTIPNEIANLVNLTSLNLSTNPITIIPNVLSSLTKLETLHLEALQLTEFPSVVTSIPSLVNLYLSNNPLMTGTIPASIENLTKLSTFYMYSTGISGEIPVELGNIPTLYNLRLNNNNLTGEIPESIGNLTSLYYLYLYNNKLTGTIPSSFENANNLDYLYLYNNELSGEIPDEIANSSIRYLFIDNNNFASIPDFTGRNLDDNLIGFRVYGNKFGFDDLIQNVGVASSYYQYSPQGAYGEEQTLVQAIGDNVILSASKSTNDDNVQWIKDGEIIEGESGETFTIDSLGHETTGTYTYQLTNAGLADVTLTSEDIRVFIPDTLAPPTVSGFSASPGNGSIHLSWNVSNASDFSMFYIYGEPTGNKASVLIDSTTNTNYTVTGLVNGSEYKFSITAKDLWGNESTHTIDRFVRPDGTPPTVVTGLTAEAGEQSVQLHWNASTDESSISYLILRGVTASNLSQVNSTSNFAYNNTGLQNGTEYFFAIIARDAANNVADTSAVVSATPMDLVPPTPHSVSLVGNNERLVARWNIDRTIPDFYAYKLYFGTSASTTTLVDSMLTQHSVNNGNLRYEFTNLTNGTEYFFRVKTFDTNANESDYSAEASATPGDFRSADSLALVAFYNALDGENWSSAWNLDNPMTTWSGVSVSDDRVIQLSMYNRNLSGTIPTEIGSLTALTYLRMGNDPITGAIPASIGNLTNLTYVEVRNTQVSTIPNEIGQLANLLTLYLYNNQIASVPESIGQLDNVTNLQLYNNAITQLPAGIGDMESLRNLSLNNNLLTSLPTTMSNLDELQQLYIGGNKFQEMPTVIGTLTSLNLLSYYGNELSTLPSFIGNLSELVTLELNSNQFTELPSEISSLTNLQTLNLSANQLTSLPEDLSGISNLRTLYLQSNHFTSFPTSIVSLTQLQTLYLYSNPSMTGPIPEGIGNLTNLVNLRLHGNDLTGSIPSSIGNLSSLTTLYLYSNELTGSIPNTIGGMGNLQYFYIYNNNITGQIPAAFSSLTNLRTVQFQDNQLTGTLPEGLENLTLLDQLYLQNNKLSGKIPESLKNNPYLRYLNLSYNDFTEIPSFGGEPIDNRLYRLWVNYNRFGFDQILKNIGVPSNRYYYAPQKEYGLAQEIVTSSGQTIKLAATKSHQDDQIQWFKNGNQLGGETTDTLLLTNIDVDDVADYTYNLTNSGASDLTLTSAVIKVLVPDSIAPPATTGLSASPRDASIILSWNASSDVDIDKYFIYSQIGEGTKSLVDSTTSTTDTIMNLVNGVEYRLYVHAKDKWGNENASSGYVTETPDGAAPSVPTNFTVTPFENRVLLAWDRVPETDGIVYRIFRGNTLGSVVYYTTTTANSYNMTGLVNGEDYFFAISAYDRALNEGDTTNVLSATPVNLTPPQIVGLSVTESNERLTFNWTNPGLPDFDRYVFYFGTESEPSEDSFSTSTSTAFTKTGLTNGTQYYFRIKVRDDDGVESPLSEVVSGIPGDYFQTDSLALIAIYNAMGGDNWSPAWDLDGNVDDWNGVGMSNGRVTSLNLYNHNLTGSIPNDIGNLKALRSLRLGADVITDSLPSSIGNLVSLTYLQIQSTQISGEIPSTIGNLTALTEMYMSSNRFSGSIPTEIGDLTSLTQLNLSSNQLSGEIPTSLGNLVKMGYLYLNSNDLTGSIPESLGNLVLLDYFYLYDNELTGELPASLGNLTNARRFYLYNNELTGSVPSTFGSLSRMDRLYLYNNRLSGSLPSQLGNLSTVRYLYVYQNNLESLPDYTGTAMASSLSNFNVSNNRLEFDDIVPNVPNFSNFTYSNQQALEPDTVLYFSEGGTMQLSISTASAAGNTIQWYKNNGLLSGETGTTLAISSFSYSDEGTYHARVTNSNAPSLTLYGGYKGALIRVKPSISSALILNPANAKFADIFVSSDMVLKGTSTVTLKGPKKTATVNLTRINETTYRASHRFTETGKHRITTDAHGISELDSVQIREIQLEQPRFREKSTISTPSTKAEITFVSSSIPKDVFILAEELSDRVLFGPAFEVDESSQIEISFSEGEFESVEKLFVYHKVGNEWQRLDTKVFKEAGKARAEITSLGEFRLGVDMDFVGNNLQPEYYALEQNYPNPFNPQTRIPFTLKENTHVKLYIYNTLGQRVRTLIDEYRQADSYAPIWYGRNDLGKKVASGMYFYQIVTPNYTKTKKMLLVK